MSNHVVLVHGRRGQESDILTCEAEEKRLEAKVEEDVLKIRENQTKKSRGEDVGEKESAPKEIGQVVHRQPRTNYNANWGEQKPNNEPNYIATSNVVQNNQTQLA